MEGLAENFSYPYKEKYYWKCNDVIITLISLTDNSIKENFVKNSAVLVKIER